MNCEEMRFLVVLDASHNITQEQKQTLDRHLTVCEDCRLEARVFGEIQVPPHACAAVRARVLDSLRHNRRRWWIWPAALVPVAACLVLVAVIATRPEPPVPVVPPAPPTEVPTPSRERQGVVVHHRKRIGRPRPTEPLVVKMFTDDPQVVIYWITAGNGE